MAYEPFFLHLAFLSKTSSVTFSVLGAVQLVPISSAERTVECQSDPRREMNANHLVSAAVNLEHFVSSLADAAVAERRARGQREPLPAAHEGDRGRGRQEGDAHGPPRARGFNPLRESSCFLSPPGGVALPSGVFILRGTPSFPCSRNWGAAEGRNGAENSAISPDALSGMRRRLPPHREAPRPPPVCGGRGAPAPGWSPAHPSSSGSGGFL